MALERVNDKVFRDLLDASKYQVFLFTCPASLPFGFARHPWLVVNRKGQVSRWEVLWMPREWESKWGHLHKDFYPPAEGISKFFFSDKQHWQNCRLEGSVEGELAARMAEAIESSPKAYPNCRKYALMGPNSNTYVQWVLNNFPGSGLRLPWNSFGKGWRGS